METEKKRSERAKNELWPTLDDIERHVAGLADEPKTPGQKEKKGEILPVVPVNAPLAKDTPANTPEKPEPSK